jgi:hypothetical protein
MADNFKNGVSRVLETANRQLTNVIWREDRPPLDSELNLMGQLSWGALSEALKSVAHSGWLTDPLRAEEDFQFFENSANYFELSGRPLVAIVNGWVVPVVGSNSDDGVANVISMPNPPTTNSETNVVFLEVWRAVLDGDTADNRPNATTIYKHGNVEYTAETLNDEMIDPQLGFSTTKRVQLQYRIRVHQGSVDLITYTEGLGSPDIYAQGTTGAPINGYSFTSMVGEGDAGLWRAGNGDEASQNDLGTIDGYVYALPICAVFRRNSNRYSAVSNGVPNHNGSISRKPSGGSAILSTPSLTNALAYDTQTPVTVSVTNYLGSGLDDVDFFGQALAGSGEIFLEMGSGLNREVFSITNDPSLAEGEIRILSRARAGTDPKNHDAGTEIRIYTGRLDGKYADQITREDLLDLRHVISLGGFDYQSLLQANLNSVLKNEIKTTFKQAGAGSNSYGLEVVEVSSLFDLNGLTRQHVNLVDAPDGIRTMWSDSPVVQPDVTFLCSLGTATDANGFTTQTLDTETTDTWTMGSSFNPQAFFYQNEPLRNGTSIFFSLGGLNGSSGVRTGIRSDLPNNVVRMIAPREMTGRDFSPVKVRFMGHNRPNGVGESGTQGLYTAPSEASNFETPFLVLGDLVTNAISGLVPHKETGSVRNLKYSDALGRETSVWAVNLGVNVDNILDVSALHGTTSLRSLITDNGEDETGFSSGAYVILHGDLIQISNNGAYKVISGGANSEYLNVLKYAEDHSLGTWATGDDWVPANANQWVYLVRVGSTQDVFATNATASMTLEIRTQYLDSRDQSCALVFTEIEDADSISTLPAVVDRTTDDEVLISVSLLYPPGHGATARVLDQAHTISLRNPINQYLRNSTSELDVSGVSTIPLPEQEIEFPTGNHISYWSGLDSYGKYASEGSAYGDTSISGQISKEAEAFVDLGSKSLLLRPYRLQNMKAYGHTLSNASIGSSNYLNGNSKFGVSGIFQNTTSTWEIPHETMPKFGRQDIPYHRSTDLNDAYMEGFNHLFGDQKNSSNGVFKIIGGEERGAGVFPLFFATGGTYGERNTLSSSNLNHNHFGASKVSISDTPTAEFGDVLRGIRLPPHFGIARLYGVYELSDFIANTNDFISGGFEVDRETELANGPTNLLRKDNHLYPIHILEDGAIVETGETGSHTYVVTEHALDISKIPAYAGQDFADIEFVVECSVFGFALGFISENNFVFVRASDGNGSAIVNTTPISNLPMVVPSPVPQSEEVYVAGIRTPYQGDPFFTVGGSSPSISDSPFRYGQVEPSLAYNFATPRGQLNPDGSSAIEVSNPRTLEVLATLDFYTTQGTGAIATSRPSETGLELGLAPYTHTSQETPIESRIPASINEALPQTRIGLFTEIEGDLSRRAEASLYLSTTGFNAGLYTGTVTSNHHLVITYTRGAFSHVFRGEGAQANGLAGSLSILVSTIISDFAEVGIPITQPSVGATTLFFGADVTGGAGNEATISIALEPTTAGGATTNHPDVVSVSKLVTGRDSSLGLGSAQTKTEVQLTGGISHPVNAGNGKLLPAEVGVTDRLPLGVLLSDFDFCGEDPLRESSKKLGFIAGNIASLDVEVPTDGQGRVYSKSVGASGELLQMGDGSLLEYSSFPTNANKKYRLLRGGGAVYGASGAVAGAPLTFLNESLPRELNPVLKGAVLAGRAMLVRNFPEEAFNVQDRADRSYGDELQLLVVTQGVARNADGTLTIGGSISPSGYGEGFAASDRYRIKGRPLIKGESVDIPFVEPAKK